MADRPRVLIFSTAYAPFVGGAEIAVKEITDRIPDMEFVMLTARLRPDLPVHEKIGNVDVYRIGKGNGWDKIRLIWEGPKKAKELGTFNLVWSIMASYSGFAALRYKKQTGTKFLLTLQEGDSKAHIYSRVWWVWPWFRQIFTKADRIQAISQYLANWGKAMGATCLIDVVPNGFDSNFFNTFPLQGAIQNFRKEFGIKHEGPLVLTVSRLVQKNGVDLLIRALSLLPVEYRLAVAGEGKLQNSLKRKAKKLRVSDRVYFLGFVPHERLKYLYRIASVFCRPSRSEGMGNVFLEAFASQLPVVATNVGGISDVVKNNETGLLAKKEDAFDIAEKIKSLVDNEQLRASLIVKADNFARINFNWDAVVGRMDGIIKQIVKKI